MYKHIFDRSNLDEIVAYNPSTKRSTTRREDLEKNGFPRSDIVLFNGTRSGMEYCLFVHDTKDSDQIFAGDIWILDMLTDEEYSRVIGIASRMRANADIFEPARKLLHML